MFIQTLRYFLLSFLLVSIDAYAASQMASDTVYLTWQRNPEATMTIQWISPAEDESDLIEYQAADQQNWQSVKGIHLPFPKAPQYLIHQIELTELTPDTLYRFRFPRTSQVYLFRTMPDHLNPSIRFVVGGDMYHDTLEEMKETSRQAAKTDPAFALIGGDIAYAVGRANSVESVAKWIEWVQAWHETMVTKEGRLIPVIAAIGNHDLTGFYDQTPAQAAIFSALFPMPGKQIYNVLDFGSYLSLFLLDSGHADPIKGAQAQWLRQALQQRQQTLHRFAIYHVPAYPSVRPYHSARSNLIRLYWVPEFEKGGVELVFENHDHAYKRTKPLLRSRINPKGVVYIGDGAWGISKPRRPYFNRKRFYLDRLASERHFVLVEIEEDKTQIKAINFQGKVMDEATIPSVLRPSALSGAR